MNKIVVKYSIPLKISDLSFSEWVKWEDRKEKFKFCSKLPGIYIMGLFHKAPKGKVNVLKDRVIYIGETVDQTVLLRWNQFNRSAFDGKHGHSGGWTFCHTRKIKAADKKNLYVACLPVDLKNGFKDAYIRYVERMLIAHYVKKHGELPICNSK